MLVFLWVFGLVEMSICWFSPGEQIVMWFCLWTRPTGEFWSHKTHLDSFRLSVVGCKSGRVVRMFLCLINIKKTLIMKRGNKFVRLCLVWICFLCDSCHFDTFCSFPVEIQDQTWAVVASPQTGFIALFYLILSIHLQKQTTPVMRNGINCTF